MEINYNNTQNGIIRLLNEVLSTHEKYKKSYFWDSGRNAAVRKKREAYFPAQEIVIKLTNGDKVTISQSYSESARNCYYSCSICLNGYKKDIRLIKKLKSQIKDIFQIRNFGEDVYKSYKAKLTWIEKMREAA